MESIMLEYPQLESEELFTAFEMMDGEMYGGVNRETIEQDMMIASMCCITPMDLVLLQTKEFIGLASIISYLYLPNKLLVLCDQLGDNEIAVTKENVDSFESMCTEYTHTRVKLLNRSISQLRMKNNKFDVIVSSEINQAAGLEEKYEKRFDLLLGTEFDDFQRTLFQSAKRLSEQGRLIIQVRIAWILAIWQQLEAYHLQFEYQEYHYYIKQRSRQNDLVWLRFTYTDNFDRERQKRNLEQYLRENDLDRLFAHRNQLVYPYSQQPVSCAKAYVDLAQNREDLQYFFSDTTTEQLSDLCEGNTACLVVPSVAVCAYAKGKNVVLFEKDNRFRTNGGVKFVKYDLYKGLNSVNYRKYAGKFDTLICDPPFNVKLPVLTKDIREFIRPCAGSSVFVIYPKSRAALLLSAMKQYGMMVKEVGRFPITYAIPPKIVRMEGEEAIQLYQFIMV